MEETPPDMRSYLIPFIVSIVLFIGVVASYQSTRNRSASIVLPGGITYLGPSPTKPAPTPQNTDGKIPVDPNVRWVYRKGSVLPYSFLIPESLILGVFPNDPFDAVTVFYKDTDSNNNIFFRVDDLAKLSKTAYRGKVEAYARDWWKEYAWNGVSSVTPITTASGLTGYRAKYLDDKNRTPYDHVFLAVPGRPDLVIWMSGKLFDQPTFEKIIDSVSWNAGN